MAQESPTICSLLTPHGRGAVAVIAINGTAAEETLDRIFKPVNGKTFSSHDRKIVYGIWSTTGEDLIVYRRSSGTSQANTKEDLSFEVHCHGGSMASAAILDDLKAAGIAQLPPQQFVQSAGSDSPGGVWKSEVLVALSQATTNRTAEILLRQVEDLPQAIGLVRSDIHQQNFDSALAQIASILQWTDFGVQLTRPRVVVFCGQPNVGKSSLVNAIVGFQRAIVNETAGTTRDVVSQSTAISGWPIELRDTAGLRESENLIESIGIEKARAEIVSADLRICVFDVNKEWNQDDQELLDSIKPGLVVLNKSDLADQPKIQQRLEEIPSSIATSVESGSGIESLIEQIAVSLTPNLPSPNTAIPVSADQVSRLQATAVVLREGLKQTDHSESKRLSVASMALERLEGTCKSSTAEITEVNGED